MSHHLIFSHSWIEGLPVVDYLNLKLAAVDIEVSVPAIRLMDVTSIGCNKCMNMKWVALDGPFGVGWTTM